MCGEIRRKIKYEKSIIKILLIFFFRNLVNAEKLKIIENNKNKIKLKSCMKNVDESHEETSASGGEICKSQN